MRKHLPNVALALLVLALLLDLIIWGAVPSLPEVGPLIQDSANSEAFLASTYIAVGQPLDTSLPSLGRIGADIMADAMGDGYARIVEAPNLAMDLVLNASYNATHRWVKVLYWSPPVLVVLFLILWATKPKAVNLIRKR